MRESSVILCLSREFLALRVLSFTQITRSAGNPSAFNVVILLLSLRVSEFKVAETSCVIWMR